MGAAGDRSPRAYTRGLLYRAERTRTALRSDAWQFARHKVLVSGLESYLKACASHVIQERVSGAVIQECVPVVSFSIAVRSSCSEI